MSIDFSSFDSVELYRGYDLVYVIRKNGGLKFESNEEALSVVRQAREDYGYKFGYVNNRPLGVFVIDGGDHREMV